MHSKGSTRTTHLRQTFLERLGIALFYQLIWRRKIENQQAGSVDPHAGYVRVITPHKRTDNVPAAQVVYIIPIGPNKKAAATNRDGFHFGFLDNPGLLGRFLGRTAASAWRSFAGG